MLKIRQQQFDQMSIALLKNDEESLVVEVIEQSQPAKTVSEGMLFVHDDQIQQFEQVALQNFENEMVNHVKAFTPVHSESIGDHAVREIVRMGISRAEKYGLTNRGPVRFYIEMMFMMGSDFDTDPQYPWANQILNDQMEVDQMKRADFLYDNAMEYIKAVYGPQYRYAKQALMRAVSKRFEDLPVSEENIANELRAVFAKKCNYIGDDALYALIILGKDQAKIYFDSPSINAAVFVGMMFIFGHGCITDPQFQWISGTLNNTLVDSPDDKLKKLYMKSISYLNHAVTRME